jgi:hypothetical protein
MDHLKQVMVHMERHMHNQIGGRWTQSCRYLRVTQSSTNRLLRPHSAGVLNRPVAAASQ